TVPAPGNRSSGPLSSRRPLLASWNRPALDREAASRLARRSPSALAPAPARGLLGAPAGADQVQSPRHRPHGAAQPRGDLGVRVALQLPGGDPTQLLITQGPEQSAILIGHQGGELGGRLGPDDLGRVVNIVFPAGGEGRHVAQLPAPALLSRLPPV